MDVATRSALLSLAQETQIGLLRQQLELDFLLDSSAVKRAVQRALADGEPRGKGLRAFQAVLAALREGEAAGTGRLESAGEQALKDLVLRFSSRFPTPMEGRTWKFTLAVSPSASLDLRGAVADLAAGGGTEGVKVRRPQMRLGRMAMELMAIVDPERHAAQLDKGKGKGRGKAAGKGKGKTAGKEGEKGKADKGAAAALAGPMAGLAIGAADAPMPPAMAATLLAEGGDGH